MNNVKKNRVLFNTLFEWKLGREERFLENQATFLFQSRMKIRNRNQILNYFKIPPFSFSFEFGELKAKIIEKGNIFMNDKNFKENKTEFKTSLLYYANLYHESVQNMIEGQREVMHDHETVLPNGEKVCDRLDRFEKFLKSIMPHILKKHSKYNSGDQNPNNQ